ncbi:MAG: hypothetical protein WC371_05375 [Parachlamydiales bacterium]
MLVLVPWLLDVFALVPDRLLTLVLVPLLLDVLELVPDRLLTLELVPLLLDVLELVPSDDETTVPLSEVVEVDVVSFVYPAVALILI